MSNDLSLFPPGSPLRDAAPIPNRLHALSVEFPTLYHVASTTSRAGQRAYVRLVRIDLMLLIIGAALSLAAAASSHEGRRIEAVLAAAALFGSAIAKCFNRVHHFDRDWFQGRSVAESVKNASWRYMMRVPPYAGDEDGADTVLLTNFADMLHSADVVHLRSEWVAAEPHLIPMAMRTVRAMSFADRKEIYLQERIRDQLVWYTAKSEENDRNATRWYWIGLLVQSTAAALAVVQIVESNFPDIVAFLTIIAVAATAWNQLRQHEGLSKTYSLVAHDLLLLRERIDLARDEERFGELVEDTEETISREHTLWMAKRS